MERKFTLKEINNAYYRYQVDPVMTLEGKSRDLQQCETVDYRKIAPGYLITNPGLVNAPRDLGVYLPETMAVDMDGDFLDPAHFVYDRFERLAEALGAEDGSDRFGFGGLTTGLLFCDCVNTDNGLVLVPAEPRLANAVAVRVYWDLRESASRGLSERKVLEHITLYRWEHVASSGSYGYDFRVLQLPDKANETSLIREMRAFFQRRYEEVRTVHADAMQKFVAHKAEYRQQFEQLKERLTAVGWRADFGAADADYAEISYMSPSGGIKTIRFRYDEGSLKQLCYHLLNEEVMVFGD